LNFKSHSQIFILNAPESFSAEKRAMDTYTDIQTDLSANKPMSFVLAFVKTKLEIDNLIAAINAVLIGDGILWFAYPKKSSKKYSVEISRDSGWDALGAAGYEGVRAVSIDQDWSVLRFRRVEYIKTMKRSADFAMSEKGKEKTPTK
jgi:hypothetical protein